MTTTPVIRLKEPRDLLAVVPYRLGFHPTDSVVVIATHRTARGTTELGLTARMDLADLAHAGHGRAAAEHLAHHLRTQAPHGVLAVLYTDVEGRARHGNGRLARAAAHLADALEHEIEPWVVGADGWGHLEPCACCPPGGHPLTDLTSSAAAAGMVVEGMTAAPRREDLAVVRLAPGSRTTSARRAARKERLRRREVGKVCGGAPLVRGAAFGAPGATPAEDQRPLLGWRADGADLWDEAVRTVGDGGTPPAGTLGRLLAFLEDRIVRDAVVAATMAGVEDATARFLDPELIGTTFDCPFLPRAEVLHRTIALAATVAAHSPPGEGAPALGLLAFVAWWGNDGARADVVAGQALAEEPGHRLAELVVGALDAGMPPMWAGAPGGTLAS
ncbi:DUF4192 domain-containing protein [Georgenia subflava]|nr:DUF4192 domain-containing protein [Georgenia subflava]